MAEKSSSLTEQVVSKASCTAQKSLRTLLSYNPLAQLETGLVVTTSAEPIGILELLRSAIVTAKKRAAITKTTRVPGKLTLQRFTGASSLAGAAAAFCFSVAACSLIFCLAPACCTAADFFAFGSAFFVTSFAFAFAFAVASAAVAFAALIVSSFAVSSASKDSWRKFFGMRIEMPKPSA